MSIDVTVLRVFTDQFGRFGNPLGIVDASAVSPRDRQRVATQLGYSETVFIDLPDAGSATAHARIFTPATELPFAGHPSVGAAWWLRDRGTPIKTLRVPAGIVQVGYESELTAVSARSDWAPEFAIHQLDTPAAVRAVDPTDFDDGMNHYLWAWLDKEASTVRARMFAADLGVSEDEATGSAAVRLTDQLSCDLTIIQGKGSIIETRWSPEGWVQVAGRVVNDGSTRID